MQFAGIACAKTKSVGSMRGGCTRLSGSHGIESRVAQRIDLAPFEVRPYREPWSQPACRNLINSCVTTVNALAEVDISASG